MAGVWKKINSNFSSKPRQNGTGFLTWSAAFNVYAAIYLKTTVQEGIRVSIDSGVRKVNNGTPASITANRVE
jgi:hypothetical protein